MALRFALPVLLALSVLAAGCTSPGENGDGDGDGGGLEARTPVASGAGCREPGTVSFEHPQPLVTLETNFGEIVIEVFEDRVPLTARNFLDLVEDGFYDGTQFHRIMRSFMMQGGNPATADPPRPQAESIQDEFHHLLRHDSAGVVSMANAGPNTGSSQFFITFAPTPHLDDKHAIFGHVVSGMDVVAEVEAEAASSDGEPNTEVVLERATVSYPDVDAPADGDLGLWTPMANPRVAADGGSTGVLLLAVSCTDRLVSANVTVEAPEGVTVEIEQGFDSFELPAAQRVVFVATLHAEAGEIGTVPVTFVLEGPGDTEARLGFELERDPHVGEAGGARGDTFSAHYVGMFVDGRMFDTSYAHLVADPQAPRAPGFGDRERGDPFSFVAGQGVIEGFTELANGLDEGATAVGRMPPEKAYGVSGQHPLAGRTLVFLLEALDIEKA